MIIRIWVLGRCFLKKEPSEPVMSKKTGGSCASGEI